MQLYHEVIMDRIFLWVASATVMLFAAVAIDVAIAAEIAIRDLPSTGSVTLSGTVRDVKNEREFTLHDNTGDIVVSLTSNKSAVLSEGQAVTVSGKVENGLLGKYINASNVQAHKNVSTAISDAIETHTDLSLDKAKKSNIGKLPNEGLVKLSGTVDDVKSEKRFAIKDATGRINVDIQSGENVILTKGTAVTVIGYVDKGLLSKRIRATHVIVTANAVNIAPAAGDAAKEPTPKY